MAPSAFFLNPPSLPGTTANREGSAGMGVLLDDGEQFFYPPHLLASAAAALRNAHWQVAGLDAVALRLDVEAALARLPRVDVLVAPVSYATLPADRAFLNRLREQRPLLKVVAIGPSLSYPQVGHALNDLVDLLLAGEPELALPAALRRLLAGDLPLGQVVNPYTLAHAAYRPDGLLADLDALPLPAWDIFLRDGLTYPFLSILSSRGCPAQCGFCPYVAAQGRQHRSQSPARTAEEFAALVQRFHPPHIMFRDPVFAHDRSRVLALCSELRHLPERVSWECESRPEHFDARLLRAMHASGCVTVKIGLETADPELLAAYGRIQDEEQAGEYLRQVAAVVEECRSLGLICRLFVLVGLPGQTVESTQRTAEFIRQVRPARLHVKEFHWYPGVGLHQVNAPDLEEQIALLQAAGQVQPGGWRRLVKRLVG